MRRCAYQIVLEVKEEFKSKVSQGLDSYRANHEDDTYPDWWHITVRQPHTEKDLDPGIDRRAIESITKEICEFRILDFEENGKSVPMYKVDMVTFLRWYNQAIDKHFVNQSKILVSQKRIGNVPLCKHNMPKGMCSCEIEEQAGREIFTPASCIHELNNVQCTCPERIIEDRKKRCASFKNACSKMWNAFSFEAMFAAMGLFLLRDTREPASSLGMRVRNICYDKMEIVWDFTRLVMSWLIPIWFWPSLLCLPFVATMYMLLHPWDSLSIFCGDSVWYQRADVSYTYCKQALYLWLSARAGKTSEIIKSLGENTYVRLGGVALCLLIVCSLAAVIKLFCSMFAIDKEDEVSEQGQAYSLGKPFSSKGEPESCYARPRTECDILDIPLHSKSLKGSKIQDVIDFYAPNLFHVITKDRTNTTPYGESGNMLFIKGHIGIIQTHVLSEAKMPDWVPDQESFWREGTRNGNRFGGAEEARK
jgi:hypothetical protein